MIEVGQKIRRKKLIQINTVCNGSTGNIMRQIQLAAEKNGFDATSFYGRRKGYRDLKCEKFGDFFSFWIHVIWTVITDRQGQSSIYYTKKMINRLRKEEPDIIHLHNIHGYYLNYPILFQYLRYEFKGKIIWTFHDCWPLTGHCAYFVMSKCERWKKLCHNCPRKKTYPVSWLLDSSRYNYESKKTNFCGFHNMTIVTPSQWLGNIVRQSFFRNNRIEVIPNGIDLNVFYPRNNKEVLKKYRLTEDKKIILGVASIWEERKGLKVFFDLAKQLDDSYVIVLVGLNKRQINKLFHNMIGIRRTEKQEEIAELYSSATVFLNPSEEETFSLVTVEAIACGTPVIVLDNSAVKELVNKETGIVLHEPIINDYISAIREIENRTYAIKNFQRQASNYTIENMINKYMELYR